MMLRRSCAATITDTFGTRTGSPSMIDMPLHLLLHSGEA
jgi:hypothetical protein